MLATQVRKLSGGRILSLAMLGGMALSTGVANVSALPQAQAAPRYTWINFDGQWLCRSWSSSAPVTKVIVPGMNNTTGTNHTVWDFDVAGGRAFGMTGQTTTTRCTTRWHIDSSMRLLSDDAMWTPNPTGDWPIASDLLTLDRTARRVAPLAPTTTAVMKRKSTPRVSHTTHTHGGTGGTGSTGGTGGWGGSGSYSPWAPVPGHPSYGMSDFGGDPYAGYFGVCTWYAWYRHQGEPLMKFGNAASWAWNAPKYGLHVGSQPVVGATVVFQPGVEGAGGGGHVGHVEAVLSGGWFIISEMNFYVNGGGWGRVNYRYVYVRSGVSFIY
ncbi:MAG TPA: CHAP domain-containing protein [Ktedonobacterales bacterium]|nr:CHAP domain-containing protein [Ktedonobacterales bacterium]